MADYHDIHPTITGINAIIAPLLGRPAWDVRLGIGSFITVEFGERVTVSPRDSRGEWLLWITYAGWLLENSTGILVSSGDDRKLIRQEIVILEGRPLQVIRVSLNPPETRFVFDEGLALSTFPDGYVPDSELWNLFTPQNKVLVLYPTGRWSYTPADQPRE